MPIYQYMLKRLLIALPTLLAISFLVLFIMRFDFTVGPIDLPLGPKPIHVLDELRIKNPIDPLAELRHNPQISKAAYEKERRRLGLDKPLTTQYSLWLSNLFHIDQPTLAQGRWWAAFQPDLGQSFSGQPVALVLAQRIPNSLILNIVTILIGWLIAIPLGIYAALHWRTKLDTMFTILAAIGMAAPPFVVALLLGVLAVKTGWFPFGGITSDNFETFSWPHKILDVAHHLVLPVVVLTIGGISGLQRQMRGNLLDVLEAEYVRVARAKGLPENKVVYKHAVRTAINPLVTLLGFEFASLMSGAAIVEMVLQYPGIGQLALEAVRQTDTNLVMSILIIAAVMLVAGNLLGDVLLKIVDPRIELQ